MKVAFVSQPIDYVGAQAQGSSIALWTDRVMHAGRGRVSTGCCKRFRVYAKHFPDQAQAESAAGVDFYRVSTRFDEIAAKPFKLAERVLGYPWRKQPFFASGLSYARYAWQIAAHLRKWPVDIVHIHNFSQLVLPIRALNPHVKIVLHMHCEWLTQLDKGLINRRLREVDQIVGCSEYITNAIRKRFPEHAARCRAIYNGVDTHLFTAKTVGQAANKEIVRLLYVGRISPEKGLHVLLDAFQKVAAVCPAARLDLIGAPGNAPYEYISLISEEPRVRALGRYYHAWQRHGGDYSSELRASLPENLADKVIFHSPMTHTELVQRYQMADMLINPSLSEAFGMSLIEAMACGLPVIAARAGGMVEIVEPDQSGLLVEADAPEELAQAMVCLCENAALRAQMGAAGREKVLRLYRWEQVGSSLWDTYRALKGGCGYDI